ncbi:hypothetical protein BJX63DRAFT_428314 [Aspergillus granulosus]|uniref:Roadblock/LAMTOR2 domain-containing protein n=1 Tax=Aspergillus granulosus TaxID=176169 RepID=A0ABR4HY19_9EURO
MASSNTVSPQIPQHVSALLSHLTSRPGVQSTFILSRKDGSIIQSTGLLAAPKRTRSEPSHAASSTPVTEDTITTSTQSPSSPSAEPQQPSSSAQTQQPPYQPSQAEALAAHIFAFVSSASNLSLSLSNPVGEGAAASAGGGKGAEDGFGDANGAGDGSGSWGASTARDDAEGEGPEGQDGDEVRLLRLRTKKHEIVVVPDKKYLLCVVHDASAGVAGATLATGGGGRR